MNRRGIRASALAGCGLLAALQAAGAAGPAAGETRLAVLPFSAPGEPGGSLGREAADAAARSLAIAFRGRPVTVSAREDTRALAARLPAGDWGRDRLLPAAQAAGLEYLLTGSIPALTVEVRDAGAASRARPFPHPAGDDRPVITVRTLPPARGPEQTTRVSLLARLLAVSTGSETEFLVEGSATGYRPDPRGALQHAATLLAREVRASLGREKAPAPPASALLRPVATAPRPRDGWVLEADSPDAVAVKLGRDHGVPARQRLLMRWRAPVAGDSSVRRTVQIYQTEVVETDTAGVILRVVGEDRRKPLPPSSEMVVLEPR